jgi:glycerol-3-phosphate acyltransferase PlsY
MIQSLAWSIGLLPALLAVGVGYLLGSIPFGLILTRLAGTTDIRSIGSGNIGATNVLRTGRKELAAATLACDILKGTVAVLLMGAALGTEASILAGFAAFLGHLFPVWLGFRGGKGVATYLGVLLGLAWPAALAFGAVWLAIAGATRYSSLAALVASAATPAVLWLLGYETVSAVIAIMTMLIWVMHYENIRRLIAGTEGRIGQKSARRAGSP